MEEKILKLILQFVLDDLAAKKALDDLKELKKEAGENSDAAGKLSQSLTKAATDEAAAAAATESMTAAYVEAGIALGTLVAGVVGAAMAVREGIETWEELKGILQDQLVSDSATTSVGNFSDQISRSAVSAAEYASALEKIKTATQSIQQETNAAIAKLKEADTAWEKIQTAQVNAAREKIKLDAATGSISHEEELRRMAALDEADAGARAQKRKQTRDNELSERSLEMERTRAEAAKAEAAAIDAKKVADTADLQPARRDLLIRNLQTQVREMEERIAKNREANEQVDWSDRVPWNATWMSRQKTLESDERVVQQFKAQLSDLEKPESKIAVDKAAKLADDSRREAEQKSLELNKRLRELESEVERLKGSNQLQDKTDSAVARSRGETADYRASEEQIKSLHLERVAGANKDAVIVQALQDMTTHHENTARDIEVIKRRLDELGTSNARSRYIAEHH